MPNLSLILGEVNPSALAMLPDGACPRSKVKPLRRLGISSETIGRVYSRRKCDRLPMLGAVARTIESPVAGIPDAPVFRTSCQKHIEDPVCAAGQSPRKWFGLADSLVLQRPRVSAVHALVHSAAKPGNVENARIHGARGIEQNVRGGGLIHSTIRFCPGLTAIIAAAHTAFVSGDRSMPPHFRTRQVMRTAVHTAGPPFHLRIEDHPIRRVGPVVRNAHRGASPGSASILAAEGPNVGICNKNAFGVEWIKMHAVIGGHIKPDSAPALIVNLARIDSVPGGAAIGGAHRTAKVCTIRKVRILVG